MKAAANAKPLPPKKLTIAKRFHALTGLAGEVGVTISFKYSMPKPTNLRENPLKRQRVFFFVRVYASQWCFLKSHTRQFCRAAEGAEEAAGPHFFVHNPSATAKDSRCVALWD